MKVGRNEPCFCGSGLKYKNCHLRAAAEPGPAERLWHDLHTCSLRLPTELLRFATSSYGPWLVDEAWREFTLFEEDTFDQDSIHLPVFMPWFFYEWEPDPAETLVPRSEIGNFPLASAYLKRRGRYQDPLATRYLRACLATAFSFHDVLTVSPGTGFTLRDALTGQESTVVEKTASRTVRKGDILFGKLVSLDGLSILDGCAPIAFPPLEKAAVIELRKHMQKINQTISAEVIKEYSLEVLEVYQATSYRLLNPSRPILQNTDGDPLIFCRVTYEVTSAWAAFGALRQLAPDESETELLADATFDDGGELLAVEIPWLKKARRHVPLANVSLGRIRIEGQRVVAEVNSEQRATLFRQIADASLPPGSRHLSTVLESVESALEAHRHDHPEGRESRELKDVDQAPEAKAMLAEQLRAYYRDWPKMKLPALKGKTPLQAIKTPDGREMVAALLLEFERKLGTAPGIDREMLAELRVNLVPPGGIEPPLQP